MATYYITCRTLALTPDCWHEHVASINYRDLQSQDPLKAWSAKRLEMIALLKQPGNEAFTYAPDGSTARVLIRRCSGGVEYLTTEPDTTDKTKENNLDELPLCSW
jgi:hypothetical protein